MAEAFGTVASVLSVIETIAVVTKTIISCKNAPDESKKLVQELSYVRGLLTTLKETIEDQDAGSWSSTLKELDVKDGPMEQLQQILAQLDDRIGGPSQTKGLKNFRQRLAWPFKESETLRLINTIERLKQIFILALENSHLRLSQLIHAEMGKISGDLQFLGQEVRLNTQGLVLLSQSTDNLGKKIQSNGQQIEALSTATDKTAASLEMATQKVDILSQAAKRSDSDRIFKWLSPWNFWTRQQEVLGQRVGETSKWILERDEFTRWMSCCFQTLYCHGPPGIGKSVLASVIVDHLVSCLPADCRVLAFFCESADTTKDKHQRLFGSFLQQLTARQCSTWEEIEKLYERHQHGTVPSANELLKIVKAEVQQTRRTYIVLDALDEWSTDAEDLSTVVSDLKSLGQNISLVVTSRPISSIQTIFQGEVNLAISPPHADLQAYIRSRLAKLSQTSILKRDAQLSQMAERTVLDGCHGLFLLARLQIDQLSRHKQRRSFIKALQGLPETPEEVYDNIMARIEAQSDEDFSIAKRAFTWLYYARQPLYLSQLQYALAVIPEERTIDQEDCLDDEILGVICGGLILVDANPQMVRFVHPTARAYLGRYISRHNSIPEATLAQDCLTFFLSDNFPAIMTSKRDRMQKQLLRPGESDSAEERREIEFLYYASKFMNSHAQAAQEVPAVLELLQFLFGNLELLSKFWQALWHFNLGVSVDDTKPLLEKDRIVVATILNLARIVLWLLDSGQSPNEADSDGQTPLCAAIDSDANDIVRILLEHGADPNQPSREPPEFSVRGRRPGEGHTTPMAQALLGGNLQVVRLLLDKGAELDTSKPEYGLGQAGSSPLHLALESGSCDVIDYVLEHLPTQVDHEGPDGNFPLHDAIDVNNLDIVATLLRHGADVSRPNSNNELPIERALHSKCKDDESLNMCRILSEYTPPDAQFTQHEQFHQYWPWMATRLPKTLRYIKEASWRSQYGGNRKIDVIWSHLSDDSEHSCLEFVRRIHEVDVGPAELEQSGLLLCAVSRGWATVVKALLQLPGDLKFGVALKTQALCEAIMSYQHDLIDCLLDVGADLNSPLVPALPLSLAILALSTNTGLIEHLLAKGADPMGACPTFGNAIRTAYEYARPAARSHQILRLLGSHGDDANGKVNDEESLLVAIARESSYECLLTATTLLEAGADVNATSHTLVTALMAAAASSGLASVEMLELLYKNGADINASGGLYGSALVAAAEVDSHASAEKIWKLLSWGADQHRPVHSEGFIEAAALHADSNIRNHVLGYEGILEDDMRTLRCQALVHAAQTGTLRTMQELVDEGVDVNAKGQFLGNIGTPLVAAACSDTNDAAEKVIFLLSRGADATFQALGYHDILQLYLDHVHEPSMDVVKLLANSGVDVNAPSGPAWNGTAIEIAFHRLQQAPGVGREWQDIVLFLHREGAILSDADFEALFQCDWFVEGIMATALV